MIQNSCSSPLPRTLFLLPTRTVARELLGKYLVRHFDDGTLAIGRIVETEAYTVDDPACHSFRGKTLANQAMFGPPGTAYIHINYGLHFCLNVVTQEEGVPEAVLIRAIEPVENAARLYRNYTGEELDEETARKTRMIGAGPGRLARALLLNKTFNGTDLTDAHSPVFLAEGDSIPDEDVVITTRIGITKAADFLWRFYVSSSRFVSKR